jgi:hypothetical protein
MTDKVAGPDGSALSEGLGLAPERAVVAYLYHDAETPEDAHPWLHSTTLVLAADRRPTLRNETPLVTLAQAEAMVAAERERILSRCQGKTHDGCAYLGRCGMVCNKCGQVA